MGNLNKRDALTWDPFQNMSFIQSDLNFIVIDLAQVHVGLKLKILNNQKTDTINQINIYSSI